MLLLVLLLLRAKFEAVADSTPAWAALASLLGAPLDADAAASLARVPRARCNSCCLDMQLRAAGCCDELVVGAGIECRLRGTHWR